MFLHCYQDLNAAQAFERYGPRDGRNDEFDVMSDRALLALVVHQPAGKAVKCVHR